MSGSLGRAGRLRSPCTRPGRIGRECPDCSRVAGGTADASLGVIVLERKAKPWQSEVGELLAQAANLCVEHGLDVDAFLTGAWSAYVEARPGLREYLEEIHLRGQLDELRKQGRLGEA